MTAGVAVIVIIALWLAVILVRAALLKPVFIEIPDKPSHAGRFDPDKAAGQLAEMVRCRTIAPENDRANGKNTRDSYKEFKKFRQLLADFYPLVHKKLKHEVIKEHSLLYHWPGKSSARPLLLMAHYDVVPADDDQWQHHPFEGVIKDGEIWGRGTIDDKQIICGVLTAVETLLKEEFKPEHDLYMAFGHDEETFGTGAEAIVEVLKSRGVKPEMVLDEGGTVAEGFFPGVSKPVALVAVAEKGTTNIEFILEGSGGHSSAPGRYSTLGELSKIILRLAGKPFKAHMPPEIERLFTTIGRHAPFAFKIIMANLWCFKPLVIFLSPLIGRELNALFRSTVVFTMVDGSDAPNVLPDRVSAVANLRLAAQDPYEQAFKHIKDQAMVATSKARRAADPLKLQLNTLQANNASPSSNFDSVAFRLLEQTIRETFPGTIVSPFIYFGATDSRVYYAICDNVYRFLPTILSKEELKSIHGVDEKLPVEKLGQVIEFFLNLIARYQSEPDFMAG